MAVMDYLRTHRTHPTAEEIFEALSPQIPTLSKTTVYNTLGLLVARGAATQIEVDPRGMRFDGDTSLHGHFFCTACGKLHDLFFDPAPQLPMPKIDGEEGYAVHTAHIYYKGLCAACRKTSDTSTGIPKK